MIAWFWEPWQVAGGMLHWSLPQVLLKRNKICTLLTPGLPLRSAGSRLECDEAYLPTSV